MATSFRPVGRPKECPPNEVVESIHSRMSLEDISEMTARITEGENSDEEIRAMAQEWIEENREQVDEWLRAARDAAR